MRRAPGPARLETLTLPNGMRIVLLEAHSNPMVASVVVVISGVADETAATNGASHFLEHLLFNGTTTRTQKQLYDDVDQIGGYNNATTRDDYTLFQFLVHRDFLDKALDIQSDMLLRSTIPEEVFEKERGIVLEEMARDESDSSYGAEQFFRRAYFGKDPRSMPVLGTSESMRAIKRQAVVDHYRAHYRPDRMVLFLAGDFERDTALALVRKAFGGEARESGGDSKGTSPNPGSGLNTAPAAATASADSAASKGAAAKASAAKTGDPKPNKPAQRDAKQAGPKQGSSKSAQAGDSGGTTSPRVAASNPSVRPSPAPPRPGFYRKKVEAQRGYLRIGLPAPGVGDPDVAAAGAIADLLGGKQGSRIARALNSDENSLAISASASYVAGPGLGRFEIEAALPPDSDGVEAARRILRELRRLARDPVSADELHAVVMSQKASDVYLRDQIHYLGMSVAADLALGREPSLGPSEGELDLLTPQLVCEVAGRWLLGQPVITLVSPVVPDGTDPSAAGAIPEAAKDEEPAAAKGDGSAAAVPPVRASVSHPPAMRVDFENGLTLLVAENPDSDIFAAHLVVRDRAALEPVGKDGIADLLHRLLPYGSIVLDGEGITHKLATLGARLKTVDDSSIPYDDYYNSPRYSYLRFETIRENWREGLGLLFSTAIFPRLDQRDLALAVSEEIDLARRASESPSARAKSLYLKTLLKDGPLSRPIVGSPETLASIRGPDLKDFHARYFSPENLILSIVSNVPATDVVEVVRSTFGAIPQAPGAPPPPPPKLGQPRRRPSAFPDLPVTEAAARVETQVGKEQSQIYLGGIFDRDPADLAPLIAATSLLSKRVAQDLRETRGLAYSVGCTLEDYGGKAWFTASMGTRPSNIDIAEAGLREAIHAFAESDIEPREIERTVNSMRGQMAMRRMTRIGQAYALGFNELLARDPDFDTKLDAALGAVTPEDIKRVARRYLVPSRMVTAIAR